MSPTFFPEIAIKPLDGDKAMYSHLWHDGAIFSDDEVHRYALWRMWDYSRLPLVVIGLNPSTATHEVNDPTIRRCIGFSKRWGHGGLVMLNLFSLRSTDPAVLKTHPDAPRSLTSESRNDHYIDEFTRLDRAADVLCAWGAHGRLFQRGRDLGQRLAKRRGLIALGTVAFGEPIHPLYIRNDRQPQPWRPE